MVQLDVTSEFLHHVTMKWTHKYDSSFGCGKLHQDPSVTVRAPNAEPVSLCQPDRQETGCNTIDLQTEVNVHK